MSVKRPRQNRVTPFGAIEASPYKGMLMGNRGDLHAPDGSLGRQWRSKRWISCILDGKGWKAPMDEPGRNYPLFFYDEAVALTAGHRPCGECRPEALRSFIRAWKVGHGKSQSDWIDLKQIDRELHADRLKARQSRPVALGDKLQDGAFYLTSPTGQQPLVAFGGKLFAWEHRGVRKLELKRKAHASFWQLTPPSFLRALVGGYRPVLHPDLQHVAT